MVRLDIWLDVVCLYKTRSEAQRACKLGQVRVNGVVAKAHREVKVGDELILQRPMGRRQTLVVSALADTHVAKAVARTLYEDRTPPPTPQEIEARRDERMFRAMNPPPRAPSKRDRREIRKLKGRAT